ncbi:hypothetical protein I5U42_10750 [Stenotrophomonas maltophilia]|uniref:hypothetical protein n=1 Tax=Stenotrophomonas sp. RAC2 TaxID=3064902 RepID=UPI0018D2B731|nr:hypothetical protein [Stenotrophomonas sp. RAC2]MBH1431773.1 hypothetical protein [Stenotrophomonas maltophilia]MDV9042341.1 hypothetical protein [Stenotrophomonas sp. RAC2]
MDVSKGIALALTAGMMMALVHLPAHVDGGGIAPNGLGCASFSPSRALPVTLEALRADPMRYHGRLVRVRGVYVDRFEMSALHPGPPVQDSWAAAGVWVNGIPILVLPPEQAVELTGIVSAGRSGAPFGEGHLGQWPAELCVSSILPLAAP